MIDIAPKRRTTSANSEQIIKTETSSLIASIPKDNLAIVLDEHGQEFTTVELAQKLANWHDHNQDISLLIGGADGLDKSYIKSSKMVWSLSKLTLPHQLVKVMLVEQLYRAWSIIAKHPYHRS